MVWTQYIQENDNNAQIGRLSNGMYNYITVHFQIFPNKNATTVGHFYMTLTLKPFIYGLTIKMKDKNNKKYYYLI